MKLTSTIPTLLSVCLLSAPLVVSAQPRQADLNRPGAFAKFEQRAQIDDRPSVEPAPPSFAPPRPGRPGRPGLGNPGDGTIAERFLEFVQFWTDEEIVELLELTDEQIAALEESFDLTRGGLDGLREDARAARAALAQAMAVDNPDLTAVNTAIDELTAVQNETMKLTIGHRVVVKTVLSEEQEDLLREYRLNERPGPMPPEGPSAGDFARRIREALASFAEDGVIDEEEMALIDARIDQLPEEIQDRVRGMVDRLIERVENGRTIPQPGDRESRGSRDGGGLGR